MSWSLDGRRLRSVLVARLRYLGDVAMSTVVIEALKRGDPQLDVAFLCEAAHAPLLAGHPLLSRCHALQVTRRGDDAKARGLVGEVEGLGAVDLLRGMRRCHYDLVVDLFHNPRSAVLVRCAGAPLRIGGARGWRRRLYTHCAAAPAVGERPAFDSIAPGGLGAHLGRLTPLLHVESGLPFLDWLEAEYGERGPAPAIASSAPTMAAAALAGLDLEEATPFTLLAPGATWEAKMWPAGSWRELVERLIAAADRAVVILAPPGGGERWAEAADAIPQGRGGLLPPRDLRVALAVTAAAAGVVSVDGGLMHAAVASRRPTVGLFGPTSPRIWFPYEGLGPFRVLCSRPACHPCDRTECDEFICLPATGADLVHETLEAVIAEAGS